MALTSGLTEYAGLGSISNSFSEDSVRNLAGKILSARVISVDQSGTSTNGSITCTLLTDVQFLGSTNIPNVLPLFPNLKNYPLVNEVVLIIALANKEYQKDFNSLTFYYISPINLWNTSQTNPLPYPSTTITPPSQNKNYAEVEAVGVPNSPTSGSNTTFKPGGYFQEKGNRNPLYSYEGDFILDGRFGNAIRLGNTVPTRTNTSLIFNNWSNTGSIGDPITIISNGIHTENPPYNSIVEDINKDNSSIYLTSTQQIPISSSSTNDYLSYDFLPSPTLPNQYAGKQIIINSGRLLLNSTTDHILLSSAKSINLNSQESINFDTIGPIILEGAEVYLGSSDANESAILGDTLVEILQGALIDLSNALGAASIQLGNNGVPLEPLGSAFRGAVDSLQLYANKLDEAKSKFVKVE